MASSPAIVEPQNERGHAYRFSPLPQSETPETETQHRDNEDEPLSSISVEPTAPLRPTVSDNYYRTDEIFSVSTRTCEMTQDLLGLTVFLVLIFLPLYRRLGSPREDPVPPVFVLNSMYVSNFTTWTAGINATWDAKFTVANTNVSSIYFRTIDFTIFYKQNPEDALSAASSYPFYLDQGEFVKLHLKFATAGEAAGCEGNDQAALVEEMGKERAKEGKLSFGMRMKVEAIYYGETWVSDVVMSPYCEDLKVQFWPSKDSGNGRLSNPNRNFSVPIQWKPFSFF